LAGARRAQQRSAAGHQLRLQWPDGRSRRRLHAARVHGDDPASEPHAMSKSFASRQTQRGISLVVVLLFLVMLSILGTTAIQTSSLEEKMTGNERDRQIAFEAAEGALRDAEREIFQSLGPTSPFDSACDNGLCTPSTTAVPAWDAVDWFSATPREYGAF